MLLNDASARLGWPLREQILNPGGAGARVYAKFAEQKIGASLKRDFPGVNVQTGVLMADPNSDSSEAPLAVVCEFGSAVQAEVLATAQRLAWNFSRTALLITVEPHQLLVWSCWLAPDKSHPERSLESRQVAEIPENFLQGNSPGSHEQQSVRELLHWVSLITGNIQKKNPKKFPSNQRADVLLLKNLKYVRAELDKKGLKPPFLHDLLARIIFTQFLFHRKDSTGTPFFDDALMEGRCDGVLREVHKSLDTILKDKEETYALFRWLDNKFNGDLFPGNENQTEVERESAWQDEKDAVTGEHLKLLSEFVSGEIDVKDRQLNLWPLYSFDIIPLEFISSVYEDFLGEKQAADKAYYTPAHLVDYILDGVLPWADESNKWDLKIFDPACGSGIFLVKAFQRLIHRWQLNHEYPPNIPDLKRILANNLLGVDKNPEAVRVACFSLYLAMADAIDPKNYLQGEKVFPPLRDTRLITQDFFDEETVGFRTQDGGQFDLILGNAPWGNGSIKSRTDQAEGESTKETTKKKLPPTKAELWAKENQWPVANNDIGPQFLAKSAQLIKESGRVALIQPASILYARLGPASDFRKKLFGEYTVEEVSNFSAVRRELFSSAVGPACVIVLIREKPLPDTPLIYIHPKPLRDEGQSKFRLIVEPYDINYVTHQEAATDPLVWPVLSIGGRRDLSLIRRLSQLPTLAKLEASGKVKTRRGIVQGGEKHVVEKIKDKPFLNAEQFSKNIFLVLEASNLPLFVDGLVYVKDSTNFEAFEYPQLLIKKSWTLSEGRMRSVVTRSRDNSGVICSQIYTSVHDNSPNGSNINLACLVINSIFSSYLITYISSDVQIFNQAAKKRDLLEIPLPLSNSTVDVNDISSFSELDQIVKEMFSLNEADYILVEDGIQFNIPDLHKSSETRKTTARQKEVNEFVSYAEVFSRVVKATFGSDKAVCATVFEEPGQEKLPVRMVAIHLNWPEHEAVRIEKMSTDGLMDKLKEVRDNVLQPDNRSQTGDGIGFQRIAFLFHAQQEDCGRVQSLYIIKPDERRYWTRSLAMRDADQLTGAILRVAGGKAVA